MVGPPPCICGTCPACNSWTVRAALEREVVNATIGKCQDFLRSVAYRGLGLKLTADATAKAFEFAIRALESLRPLSPEDELSILREVERIKTLPP